jgi:hypothetical protein
LHKLIGLKSVMLVGMPYVFIVTTGENILDRTVQVPISVSVPSMS